MTSDWETFRRLWIGRVFTELGTSGAAIAIPLLVAREVSLSAVAFVFAAASVGTALGLLVAGSSADRWGPRRSVLVAASIRVVVLASFAVAAVHPATVLLAALAAAFGVGATQSVLATAETVFVRRVIADDDLGRAFSRNQARAFAADIAGAPIAGLLFAWSAPLLLWFLVLTGVVEVVVVSSRRLRGVDAAAETGAFDGALAGLRYIARSPFFRRLVVGIGMLNFATLWPVLLVALTSADAPSWAVGAVSAAMSLVGFGGSLLATRIVDRLGQRSSLAVSLGASVALLVGAASVAWPWVTVGMVVAVVGVIPTAAVVVMTAQTSRAPAELLGRVSAAGSIIAMAAMPLGNLVAGIGAAQFGERPTLALFAAVVLAGMWVLPWQGFASLDSQTQPAPSQDS